MTDSELLGLLEEKMPEELTIEEIELLRCRLAESPALREALAGQIYFESYLQAALARLNTSPEQIAARARRQQASSGLSLVLIVLMIVLPSAAILGLVGMNALFRPELAQQALEEEQQPGQPEVASPEISVEQAGSIQPPSVEQPAKQSSTPAVTADPAVNASSLPSSPWQAVIESALEPPKFEQVAFETFDLTKAVIRREQLQQWFEAVPGQNYRLHEVDTNYGRCGALEGIARLKAPWLPDSLLRMSIENFNKLQIHLYHGNQGVTLVYHHDQLMRWAAYCTRRKPKTVRPDQLAVTSTDDTRNWRTESRYGGPVDLRYYDGHIILSRGDVVLVRAPLAGPPDDVYFDGRVTFNGLQLLRTSDAPQPLPQRKLVYQNDRPGNLPWKKSTPEAEPPQPNSDGSVTFRGNQLDRGVWYWIPLPRQGLQQVTLQLTGITPGVGVYLGREGGQPNEGIRFFKNRRNGRLVAKLRGIDRDHEIDHGGLPETVEPLANPENCWVRLAFGTGTFRCWLSTDGENWARPDFIREMLPGGIDSIGLFLVGGRPSTQVTVRRIELRELSGITNLAKDELRGKAQAFPAAADLSTWKEEVRRAKPADVDAAEWTRACAVQTLGVGAGKDLSHSLLEMLLDDSYFRSLPVEDQLAAYDDAFQLVSDLRDGQSMKTGLVQRLANVGMQAFQEHGVRPWSTIRRTYQTTPIHTIHFFPRTPLVVFEPLIRSELIQLTYQQQHQELLRLCEELRFFHAEATAPLITWAEAHARRETASRAAATGNQPVMRETWRPLLVEEVSKETYNLTSELQAVLESEAWEDAARIITSVDPEAVPGVSPYVKDRQLLTALPVAVQLLLRDYPQLKNALGNRYGPLAKLRISQAIAAADTSAVELATVQFGATVESAEALRWLGDRALSNGWFEEAIAHYERAIERHSLLADELTPRIRLAAAMLGRDAGEPPATVVQFNDLKLEPEAFETLVAEMKSRGTSAALSSALHIMPGVPLQVPPPTVFATHYRSRLDGPVGERPQEEVGRKTNQFSVPWPDRQMAAAIEGDLLYVSNRFQVAAYNMTNGQRVWQSEKPPGSMSKSQDWALIAMRPLVLREQILARQLYGRSPQIVCLEKSSGKLIWSTERGDREFFVSDPVYVHGQIVALSIAMQEQQEGQLRWNVLDPATGELQLQRDLIRLRNTWGSRACCEVLPLDHHSIVALGGITIGLDARGQVSWVRKQVTLPADEDPRWVLQSFHRPLLVARPDGGEQVILTQPGTRSIIALDPVTGLAYWETVLPDVVGCWGVSLDRLIVQTETGVQAIDVATGKRLWFTPINGLQPHALVDGQKIFFGRQILNEDQKNQIELVWLDPATGAELGATKPATFADATPRLGLLIPYRDRLFIFFGKGQHDPTRDVVELIPSGPVE